MKFDQKTLKAWNKSKHPLRPVSPHLLRFCSLSFWPACPQFVYEKRGSWQVAVCKGIEVYEIFTKAIMTPWTGWVVEKGAEKRRGRGAKTGKQESEGEACFLFSVFFSQKHKKEKKQRKMKEAEQTPPDIRWWLKHQTVELRIVFVHAHIYKCLPSFNIVIDASLLSRPVKVPLKKPMGSWALGVFSLNPNWKLHQIWENSRYGRIHKDRQMFTTKH